MAFFKKNPNEARYYEGKKHWVDVLKNTAPEDFMIWRQPEEDFNNNSTLIVMPGEAAIFVNEGRIEEVFYSGTYRLSTENYPFLSRLRNSLSGGISAFHCVVYFVRAAHTMEIKWGTASPIEVRDKVLGIATKMRARGAYKVEVENPALFLNKLIGSRVLSTTEADLDRYFAQEFQSKIKSAISAAVQNRNGEILGIDSRMDELSQVIAPMLNGLMAEYGLRCAGFAISAIDVDDTELRRQYDAMGMDAIAKMRNAQADRAVMDLLGDKWEKQQSVYLMGQMIDNVGGGDGGADSAVSSGANLGMGLAAMGMMGSMAQQMVQPFAQMGQQPFGQMNQQPGQPYGQMNQQMTQPFAQMGQPAFDQMNQQTGQFYGQTNQQPMQQYYGQTDQNYGGMGQDAGQYYGQMGQMPGNEQGNPQAGQFCGQMEQRSGDGQSVSAGVEDPMAALQRLKQLYENELITFEEYNAKRNDILSRL